MYLSCYCSRLLIGPVVLFDQIVEQFFTVKKSEILQNGSNKFQYFYNEYMNIELNVIMQRKCLT